MKFFSLVLAMTMLFSFGGVSCASGDDDSGGANDTLGGAVLGGLLGGGIGTAIGSASGNAGKGALWGAGIGAVGGALLGSSRSANKARATENMAEPEPDRGLPAASTETAPDMKVKKRIIKSYDQEGNLVSQKEVAN
ncbi:MAG: hypothetical protein PHI58_01090 [Candidatus Omnitrophica bacterium]|nr:hypothetical protein [Candidatus Omnitrophota bacterium]